MALALLPTLAELRAKLFIRLGMETQGGQASPDVALFDEWIRQANLMLWLECEWLRSRTRFSMPLVTGQSIYDWPDGIDPGHVEIIELADSDNKVFPLTIGIDFMIRNLNPAASNSRPMWYDVRDNIIEILPAPSEQFTTLYLTGELGPASLEAEGDRCNVDPEALLQLATIMGREHFGMGDVRGAEARLARFLTLSRANQGPSRMRPAATKRYVGVPSLRWRRLQPYASDWNPW